MTPDNCCPNTACACGSCLVLISVHEHRNRRKKLARLGPDRNGATTAVPLAIFSKLGRFSSSILSESSISLHFISTAKNRALGSPWPPLPRCSGLPRAPPPHVRQFGGPAALCSAWAAKTRCVARCGGGVAAMLTGPAGRPSPRCACTAPPPAARLADDPRAVFFYLGLAAPRVAWRGALAACWRELRGGRSACGHERAGAR